MPPLSVMANTLVFHTQVIRLKSVPWTNPTGLLRLQGCLGPISPLYRPIDSLGWSVAGLRGKLPRVTRITEGECYACDIARRTWRR
jgi:hypothetical protein